MRLKTVGLRIWELIKEGKSIRDISQILKIHEDSLHRFLKPYKANGTIKKVGYGSWKLNAKTTRPFGGGTVASVEGGVGFEKVVRGHGFLFKLRLQRKIKFQERQEILNKAGLNFKITNNHGIPYALTFVFRGFRIRFTERSLLIWQPKDISWFGNHAFESRNKAVTDLQKFLRELEVTLKLRLDTTGSYKFHIARNHYALIKNELAKEYNKDRKKLFVEDQAGLWLIIDNSFNLNELETIHSLTAVDDNIKVQLFFNELKETNLTPKKIIGRFERVEDVLVRFIEAATPKTQPPPEQPSTPEPLNKNKDLKDYIG